MLNQLRDYSDSFALLCFALRMQYSVYKLFVRMEMKFYYDEISSYLVAANILLVSRVQCPLLISSLKIAMASKQIESPLFHTQRTIFHSSGVWSQPFFINSEVHMNHPSLELQASRCEWKICKRSITFMVFYVTYVNYTLLMWNFHVVNNVRFGANNSIVWFEWCSWAQSTVFTTSHS